MEYHFHKEWKWKNFWCNPMPYPEVFVLMSTGDTIERESDLRFGIYWSSTFSMLPFIRIPENESFIRFLASFIIEVSFGAFSASKLPEWSFFQKCVAYEYFRTLIWPVIPSPICIPDVYTPRFTFVQAIKCGSFLNVGNFVNISGTFITSIATTIDYICGIISGSAIWRREF